MISIVTAAQPVLISDVPLLAVLLRNRVCAGVPSLAEDLGAPRIDLAAMLITHAQASYFLRASGTSMVVDRTKLKAANPTFADIVPKEGQTIEVWGVLTSCIKQFKV